MKKILNLFLPAVMMAVMVSTGFAEVTAGDAAADFTATDTKGRPQTLSDYKGKFVVLEWFNVDCPFVKKHYGSGNMQRLQKTYTDKGVVWLSVCSSAPEKQGHYTAEQMNAMMAEKQSKATAVVLDASGDIGKSYGAKTTPHIFIINPEGTVIYQGAIDSIASTDPADIEKSENYVQAALDAAMAGKTVAVSATKSYGCSVKY